MNDLVAEVPLKVVLSASRLCEGGHACDTFAAIDIDASELCHAEEVRSDDVRVDEGDSLFRKVEMRR
jgi:hypothetical protein